jgi:hypothetical protein
VQGLGGSSEPSDVALLSPPYPITLTRLDVSATAGTKGNIYVYANGASTVLACHLPGTACSSAREVTIPASSELSVLCACHGGAPGDVLTTVTYRGD